MFKMEVNFILLNLLFLSSRLDHLKALVDLTLLKIIYLNTNNF